MDALPTVGGYVDLRAAVGRVGASAIGEVGYRASPSASLYAYAGAEQGWRGKPAASAGVGFRWRW